MTKISLVQTAVLGFAMAVVIGILGWTGAIKISGLNNAPTREANGAPHRLSDIERPGRVYPGFK